MIIEVRGVGSVRLGPIHSRFSRMGVAQSLLGGRRHVDQSRQEFFSLFHPGNFKPPLLVYFAGYGLREGFEGYNMMRSFDRPFLLISDPRIEGGEFYLGSKEYEQKIIHVIEQTLSYLQFESDDLVLSGLSMGTFGALYYGAQMNPHAIIVGKPLVSPGRIAHNHRLKRPDVFATVLDTVRQQTGNTGEMANRSLDQAIAQVFKEATLPNTEIISSYMIHDDYDDQAMDTIHNLFKHSGAKIVSKGFPGRHNDNSAGINGWFIEQYWRVLRRYDIKRGQSRELSDLS